METIEIDFDVFKELTIRRSSEQVTYNDVLRELLGLPPADKPKRPHYADDKRAWVSKGVTFPEETRFRARFKGQLYSGEVQNGALVVNGKRFYSPSPAAMSITGKSVNGWVFWECQMPGQTSWVWITELRKDR